MLVLVLILVLWFCLEGERAFHDAGGYRKLVIGDGMMEVPVVREIDAFRTSVDNCACLRYVIHHRLGRI